MVAVERPTIFHAPKDLLRIPFYLRTVEGRLLIDSSYAAEGARIGPYDTVMDFGNSRASLRELVPENQRLATKTDSLKVLGFAQPDIRRAMDAITNLANDPSRSSEDSNNRQEYRENLRNVYKAMAAEVSDWVWAGTEEPLIFAPKNGGIFVQQVFEEEGFFPSDFFDYRMSRVQKKDGGLMVGITNGENNPEISSYRSFVFADDCMASDISAFATMEMVKEALIVARIPLTKARVLIAISAATQRGSESLLSPETKQHFGFGDIKAVVGMPVYKMDSHFYLQHPDDRYVVGDMGNWTQPPTE